MLLFLKRLVVDITIFGLVVLFLFCFLKFNFFL